MQNSTETLLFMLKKLEDDILNDAKAVFPTDKRRYEELIERGHVVHAAREKIKALNSPDYYFITDNWEVTHEDLGDLMEYEVDDEDIVQVGRLSRLPDIYVARYSVEDDNREQEFDTYEKARAFLDKIAKKEEA